MAFDFYETEANMQALEVSYFCTFYLFCMLSCQRCSPDLYLMHDEFIAAQVMHVQRSMLSSCFRPDAS